MSLMSFFQRVEKRNLESPNYKLDEFSLLGDLQQRRSSTQVTPEQASTLTAVYACIYVLSSTLAHLPINVMHRGKNRKTTVAEDHPAHFLLRDKPNFWQTSYKWRETQQSHTLGWGNGYSRIVRARNGEMLSFEPCHPSVTRLVKNGSRWIYETQDEDRKAIAVAVEDMIHIRAIGTDGKEGLSPIRQNSQTIGLGLAAARYGLEFFEGGGRPSALITPKGDERMNDDGWTRFKQSFKKMLRDMRQGGSKTLFLPCGIDYQSLTIPPEDAQFLETRKMTRSEIASIFNVPSHMINDLEKATFSNISEQALGFARYCISPWVRNWEEELGRKLLTTAERRAGYRIKFNLKALLRGTPTERAEFYRSAILDGWMSRNEVREHEDYNSLPGLDTMLVNVNARMLDPEGRGLPTKEALGE